MSRPLGRRLHTLRMQMPDGCPACQDWSLVWLMTDGDPEPPKGCDQCGRRFAGLVRVYQVGIDPADI